jgi:hypothetical protein
VSAVHCSRERVVCRKYSAWMWLVLCFLLAAPAAAERTRPMSLVEMTRAAGTIVVGRVTEVRVGSHPQHPRVPVTHVTVRVEETWKGAPGRELVFMQFGDASGAPPDPPASGRVTLVRFPDMPTYAEGEEVLLFLRRPSRADLTSPVGGRAGKLAVRRELATGQVTVEVGPVDLSDGSHTDASRGGTVPLSALRARVLGAAPAEVQER